MTLYCCIFTYGDLCESNVTELLRESSSTAASNIGSFPVDWRSRLSPFRYDTPKRLCIQNEFILGKNFMRLLQLEELFFFLFLLLIKGWLYKQDATFKGDRGKQKYSTFLAWQVRLETTVWLFPLTLSLPELIMETLG